MHLTLDYADFRAFFLVGVPPDGDGDFGCAYDASPHGAYDAQPFVAFHDGYPVGAASFYRTIYQGVDSVKAGGVGWDLYVETIGCP
jgi:hypothetical protein